MFGRRKRLKDDFDNASFAANIARLDGLYESTTPDGDDDATAEATAAPDAEEPNPPDRDDD